MEIIVPIMEQLGLDLNLLKIFIKVVECQSFSEASRVLKIPKSTVSRSVSRLEKDLGVQLIIRTTRQFNLTQQGVMIAQDSKRILNELDATLNSLSKNKLGTHGLVKLTAPLDLAITVLNPLMADFSQQNPFINIDVEYTDDVVNVVRDGFDLALRIGSLSDSRLKAKKIGETAFGLYASPQYILKNGECEKAEDLLHFNYLHFSRIKDLKNIKLQDGKSFFYLKNKPQININNLECLRQLIVSGKGFGLLPDFFAQADVEKGNLIPILKSYRSMGAPISWVYPLHKEDSIVTKKLRDFLTPQIQRKLYVVKNS